MRAHFTTLPDLASERVGGEVLFANDDFFAPKESLVKAAAPVFLAEKYTERGKWMDGWESRRRRTSGFDFCVVRLGIPGVIRGVDVDTAHFTGNFPAACSLDGATSPDGPWAELLPKSALRGDAHNLFPVRDARRFTHVRLSIHPDGGVARLRIHGEAVPDWSAAAGRVDLAALENGGLVLAFSDAYFGSHQNLLMPGRGAGMHDGWETRRSRRPGADWVIVRLGARGVVSEAEVDTHHFKGNFPAACSLDVCDAPGADVESLTDPARAWRTLLDELPLGADTRHLFRDFPQVPATHARLRIHPDGGVSRLRLRGALVPPPALARLNEAAPEVAFAELLRCCGAKAWAERLAARRPFTTHLELLAAAEDALDALSEEDWLEAFRAHPRIGERGAAGWASREQAGALAASGAVLEELAEANAEYEKRFGFVFIVCASGRPAWWMLASLKERLSSPRDIELRVAAEEQRAIARLRLAKLLREER